MTEPGLQWLTAVYPQWKSKKTAIHNDDDDDGGGDYDEDNDRMVVTFNAVMILIDVVFSRQMRSTVAVVVSWW